MAVAGLEAVLDVRVRRRRADLDEFAGARGMNLQARGLEAWGHVSDDYAHSIAGSPASPLPDDRPQAILGT